jgi:hypothetical protein
VAPPVSTRAPRKPKAPLELKPFTLQHFLWWSADLVLDSGERFVCEPFQAAVVRDILAGVPEVWDIVPEGNGKSTLIAIIALYYAEFQPYAAIPVAAASREQAEIIYRQCEGFVLRTPRLHEAVTSAIQIAKGKQKTEVPRFVCLEGYRRINHVGGGRIQVFAADDRTGDGIIPTLAIIDEPHRQRDLSLYRTWTGKLLKRKGQIVAISTAGEPGTDFELTREKIRQAATKVTRKGSFTRYAAPGIVLHEWALPEKANPEDFRAVKRANPFSGITIATLRDKFARPTMTRSHWLRFVCNRPTRSEAAAISEPEWRTAGTPAAEIPEHEPVSVGLTMAWKSVSAAVPLWWRDREHRVLGPASVLVPPRDGNGLDPRDFQVMLEAIHERNPIATVVMPVDRAKDLAVWIRDRFGADVIDRGQTPVPAIADYDAFMEALRSGWLHHGGDPVLTTHVLNAVARDLPGGATRFDAPTESRGATEHREIAALVAAAAANGWAAEPPPVPVAHGFLAFAQTLADELPAGAPSPVALALEAAPDVALLCGIRARMGTTLGPCRHQPGHGGGHLP